LYVNLKNLQSNGGVTPHLNIHKGSDQTKPTAANIYIPLVGVPLPNATRPGPINFLRRYSYLLTIALAIPAADYAAKIKPMMKKPANYFVRVFMPSGRQLMRAQFRKAYFA
ncbi:hypothetical protein CLOM_g22789, partial [Closterium sp. NIES-68]